MSAGSAASPYAVSEPRDDHAVFSAVELASGELAGEALLWRSTCTTGGLILDCRCGLRSGAAAWARTWSWRCAGTASPSAACTASSRHAGQQHGDDPGGIASWIRPRGHAPQVGVGQRGVRRRSNPRRAGNRLGRGRDTGRRAGVRSRAGEADHPAQGHRLRRRPLGTSARSDSQGAAASAWHESASWLMFPAVIAETVGVWRSALSWTGPSLRRAVFGSSIPSRLTSLTRARKSASLAGWGCCGRCMR